jgi:two-component system, LuxR family, response regulator DctR
MIFIVDDDSDVRDALAWLLRSRRHLSEGYVSGEAFLAALDGGLKLDEPSCLLLDVRMPGMSGLGVFEHLIERDLQRLLPVIFLSGHADVPTAVDAVKRGAFDFCEKPSSDNALVDRVELALASSQQARAVLSTARGKAAKLAELTEREREVMRLVADGVPNKLVADRLNISVRTVEVHRSRVFDKMGVRSAAELANALA